MSKVAKLASLCLLLWFAIPSYAGRVILLDSGNDPVITPPSLSNYQFTGQYFLQNDPSPTLVLSGSYIPLDFGTGAPGSRRIVQDVRGQLVFVDASGNPTGDFIAPLLASTGYTPASQITKSEGRVDPGVLGPSPAPSPYDYANALSAYRFTWSAVCPLNVNCNGNPVTFQVILAALGPDSFLIDFNYSDFNLVGFAASAGFSLGGVTQTFGGPYATLGPTYCFIGGVLGSYAGGTTCRIGPAAVPEPPTVALIFGALAALAALGLRRRTRTGDRDAVRSALASPAMA